MLISIEQANPEEAGLCLDLIARLLDELGEEGEETGEFLTNEILAAWRASGDKFQVFLALTENGDGIGIVTVIESFAIYANGIYGIINEMYVVPQHRSEGIGKMLIDAVKDYGKQKKWSRIDVTAPESERWEQTRRFYEKQDFVFTGPKLKFSL